MIEVEVDAGEEWDSRIGWAGLAREAVHSAVRHSAHASLLDLYAEVSVKLTSDEEVHALNKQWRGKDKPTNVLSFPMAEPEDFASAHVFGELLLGDIVLAHGVCAREAAERGIAAETHATHLIVHGMLHLLGYDHELGNEEAEEMEAIERQALAALGIADPYAMEEVHD